MQLFHVKGALIRMGKGVLIIKERRLLLKEKEHLSDFNEGIILWEVKRGIYEKG